MFWHVGCLKMLRSSTDMFVLAGLLPAHKSDVQSATCKHGRCYARNGVVGWGGGVGCNDIVELARMVDAPQEMGWWGGVGCNDIVELARMVDATQEMGWCP